MAKDLFSDQSKTYAKYRPTYPQELFDYILQFVEEKKCAWDCGTGNGQAANILADYFQKVIATDISEAQISNAVRKPNIEYHICPAEQTPFDDNSFDLITVATAYHWFHWKQFRNEARRVGKNNAVIAAWAYNTFSSKDENINELIQHFYNDVVYAYWDTERRHVENSYAAVDFDYDLLPTKDFEINLNWTKEQFIGYMNSWSATRNYIKANHSVPTDLIRKQLDEIWNGEEAKPVYFPVFLKLGRIIK